MSSTLAMQLHPNLPSSQDSRANSERIITLWSNAVDVFNSQLTKVDKQKIENENLKCIFSDLLPSINSIRDKIQNPRYPDTELLYEIISKINRYASFGGVILQHHTEYTSLIWGTVRLLLLFAVERPELSKHIAIGLWPVIQLVFRVEEYARLFLAPVYSNIDRILKILHEDLIYLYAEVLNFLVRSTLFFQKRSVRRFIFAGVNSNDKFQTILVKINIYERSVERTRNLLDTEAHKQQEEDRNIWYQATDFAANLNRLKDEHLQDSQAEAIHRQTLNIKRRVLGEQHPDTLKSVDNLALVLNKQGKDEEAEELNNWGKYQHGDEDINLGEYQYAEELNNQGKYKNTEELNNKDKYKNAEKLNNKGKCKNAEELDCKMKVAEGTDQIESLSSFSAGSSVASTSSSQTDLSSLTSNRDIARNAAQHFAILLFQDSELRNFYQKGFKELGSEDFMTKHDGLLKSFFQNIRQKCQDSVQINVIRLLSVRSQRYEVFSTIRKNFTSSYTIDDQAFADLKNQKPSRKALLERYLSRKHIDEGDSTQEQETSDEDQSSNNSDSYELHPNLDRIVEFLIKGESFAEFRSSLSSLLRLSEPTEKSSQSFEVTSKSALVESYSEPRLQKSGLPEKTRRENREPSTDSAKYVAIDRNNGASHLGLSLVANLQETNSRCPLGWKFFLRFTIFRIGRFFRPRLKLNYSRLEWICDCGTPLYDDFGGPIEALQKLASDLKGKVISGPAANFVTAQAESNQSREHSNLAEGAPSDHRQARPGTADNSSTEVTGQLELPINVTHHTAVEACDDNYRWLEICIQSGDKLHVLEEIDTRHNTTDRDVFLKIRQRYETLNKSRMGQSYLKWLRAATWLSLRKASGPKFIGFCLNTVGFTSRDPTTVVIVNDHPSYPDEKLIVSGQYSFKLAPGETPISTRAFNHFLHYAESEAHNTPFWILRFPHLLDDSLLGCGVPQKKAWGLELTERWNWTSFCVLNTCGLLLSAMISALVWVFTRDTQTGVAIGAWCSTIQALVVTAVFFEWSNL